MKIVSSDVNLAAAHSFYQEDVTTSSFSFWRDDDRQEDSGPAQTVIGTDRTSFSKEGLSRLLQSSPVLPAGGDTAALSDDAMAEDPKLRAMRLTLELLTGRKLSAATFHPVEQEKGNAVNIPAQGSGPATSGNQPSERVGWGMEYDYLESHTEQESMNFSADGFIITADGRKIEFSHELRMERLFAVESKLHIQAGDARLVDPLVINFSGQGSRLSDVRINFDLDGDGREEEITFVAPDSGFLALDRNGDGRINDGTELFGPASGHGFAELAGFDADANGWLDENDPVFAKLKVWMTDQAGKQRLLSLAETQVGALLLTPLDSEFTLTDSSNSPLGQIRQTSLAFLESGAVAAIQELDLVV